MSMESLGRRPPRWSLETAIRCQVYFKLPCLPRGGPQCEETLRNLPPELVLPLGIVVLCCNCPVYLNALKKAEEEFLQRQENDYPLSK